MQATAFEPYTHGDLRPLLEVTESAPWPTAAQWPDPELTAGEPGPLASVRVIAACQALRSPLRVTSNLTRHTSNRVCIKPGWLHGRYDG